MSIDPTTVALLHLADFLAVGGQALRVGNVHSLLGQQAPPRSWPQLPDGQEHGLVYEAAVANATAAHVLDWDDVMLGVPNHPGCVIWPALLASASPEATVRSLCAAFLEGVGVAAELADCVGADHYSQGWHATTTVGRMAAAYAAALVRHDDSTTAWTAMQLAAVTSSGFNDVFGTSVKAIQVGLASGAATHAALLAGTVADMPDVLVPESSLGRILGVQRPPRRRESYVSDAALGRLRIKEYPCCYFAHAPVLAALEIIGAGATESGQQIVLEVSEGAARVCTVARPSTIEEARFSLPYLVASALEGFTDGALGLIDGSVLSSSIIAKRAEAIEITVDRGLGGMAAAVRAGEMRMAVNLEGPSASVGALSVRSKAESLPSAMRDLIELCVTQEPQLQRAFLDSTASRLFVPTDFRSS